MFCHQIAVPLRSTSTSDDVKRKRERRWGNSPRVNLNAFVNDSFQAATTTSPILITNYQLFTDRQHAINYCTTRYTRPVLRTTELTSSLHLRQLPNHHIVHSTYN